MRKLFVLLAIVSLGISLAMFVGAPQRTIDRLANKLRGNGPQSLTLVDRAFIYSLAIMMTLGGAVAYPEAAREQFFMFFPGPATRTWKSDFPMSAPRVQQAVDRFSKSLLAIQAGTKPIDQRTTIVFDYDKDPLRTALALNATDLRIHAAPVQGGWKLALSARVQIRYPPSARTSLPLPFGRQLVVEEGLFWVLQKAGWLFPYIADWEWEARLSAR